MSSSSAAPSRRPLVWLVLGEFAILGLLAFAVLQLQLQWVGAILIGLVAALFPILFVRRSEAFAAARGNLSSAMKRYNRRMIAASIVYVAGLLAAVAIADLVDGGFPLKVGLALLASAGVLLMIRAMARLLVEENDEYQRLRIARSALFATGVVLVVTTVYGFLEQFGGAPHVAGWATVPVFGVGLGLSHTVEWLRP